METVSEIRKSGTTELWKEFTVFYLLFASVIISVYYLTPALNQLYFLLLLLIFWRSSRNYFWFALFFVLYFQPAGLFLQTAGDAIHRLPLYQLAPGLSFSIFDLFFGLFFLKAILRKQKPRIFLSFPLILLLLYFIIQMVISLFSGIDAYYVVALRHALNFTVFFSFPILINREEDIDKFMYLQIPVILLILFSQVYFLVYNEDLEFLFNREDPRFYYEQQLEIASDYEEILRPTRFGSVVVYFITIASLILLNLRKKKILLLQYLAPLLSFFIVILSATRSWFLLYSLFFLGLVFIYSRRLFRTLPMMILVIGLSIFLINRIEVLNIAAQNSLFRLSTITEIAQGNVEVEGSSAFRVNVRLPRVIEGIRINPITGLGFTRLGYEYYDPHVGNFSLLVQVGFIGFLFFGFYWYRYITSLVKAIRRTSPFNPYRRVFQILLLGFIGMLFFHFTSLQFFGYDLSFTLFIAIYNSLTGYYINNGLILKPK